MPTPRAVVSRLAQISTVALVFNLFVIVWGAFVRASNSGAGCGSHWPLCNGEVIPRDATVATAIEFAHRATSGMCLILAAWIARLGWKHFERGTALRRSSMAVLALTLSEAAIGAGLVLFGWVEKNESLGRVVSITLHLTNTFALLAALALTAAWSRAQARGPLEGGYRLASRPGRLGWVALASVALTICVAMSGAITALGDTLFRASSLREGLMQDLSAGSHFLLRLRALHPLLAVLTAGVLFYFAELAGSARRAYAGSRFESLGMALKGFVGAQLVLGLVNLLLLAPTILQLAHLLVAEGLWITLILTVAAALQDEPGRAPAARETPEGSPSIAVPEPSRT